MLAAKLIPFKFISIIVLMAVSGVLLPTESLYPTNNGTTSQSFIACAVLIIVFSFVQLAFTFIGINIYNTRIHFENLIFNSFAGVLLVWFVLGRWQKQYVWYIWGFLMVYPFLNEIFGMISMISHNSQMVYQKYTVQS